MCSSPSTEVDYGSREDRLDLPLPKLNLRLNLSAWQPTGVGCQIEAHYTSKIPQDFAIRLFGLKAK